MMINLVKKVIPNQFKRYIRKQFELNRINGENKIPRYEIEEKHIANLKAVKNRNILIDLLPKNAIVAEIGVDKGNFSENILKIATPKKLHLIDIWNSERYHEGLKNAVETAV